MIHMSECATSLLFSIVVFIPTVVSFLVQTLRGPQPPLGSSPLRKDVILLQVFMHQTNNFDWD